MAQKHGWIPVCKENDQRRAVRGTHAHRASRMGKGLSFLKFRFNPKATRVALLSAFQLDWLPLHSCVPLRGRQFTASERKERKKREGGREKHRQTDIVQVVSINSGGQSASKPRVASGKLRAVRR